MNLVEKSSVGSSPTSPANTSKEKEMRTKQKRGSDMFSKGSKMFSNRVSAEDRINLEETSMNLVVSGTNGPEDVLFGDWTDILQNGLAFRRERNEV